MSTRDTQQRGSIAGSLRKLKRGSRVAVVSPASAAKNELIDRGCERLHQFGYEPVLMPHAKQRGPLYYAGTAAERVSDLHAAFADSSIEALICTRGGWGSAELMPLLRRELIAANPKWFVGYSDHTSLHAWLWNECRLPTIHGPMVAADWSKDDGIEERTWRALAERSGQWSITKDEGWRMLREGNAEGRLLGGCLAILEAGLGTPYALRVDEPCVLFVEDIGVKPYQWDRMLQHLRFAGMMKNVRGVVLGDMSASVDANEMELLEAACLHALGDFAGPVAMGVRSGHVSRRNCSLPLGSWVRMDESGMRCTE